MDLPFRDDSHPFVQYSKYLEDVYMGAADNRTAFLGSFGFLWFYSHPFGAWKLTKAVRETKAYVTQLFGHKQKELQEGRIASDDCLTALIADKMAKGQITYSSDDLAINLVHLSMAAQLAHAVGIAMNLFLGHVSTLCSAHS